MDGWRDVVRYAVLGTVLTTALVMMDSQGNLVALLQPGTDGPSIEVFEEDFPDVEPPDGLGFDGQQFYAVARSPFDLDETSEQLDRPRYRLRRPAFPMAVWALHPTGGGEGLAAAFLVVGVLGLLIGGLATGALSIWLRGPPWAAAVFPLLPGAYFSLRVSVADAFSLAFAVAALALLANDRARSAIVAGVVAVLAKETALLVLLGWAIHRRTRQAWLAVGIPAAVLAAWVAVLPHLVPEGSGRVGSLVLPFAGIVQAAGDRWIEGQELWGAAGTLGGLALAGFALHRHALRHPLSWVLVLQVLLVVVGDDDVVGNKLGGPRVAMGLMLFAALMLLTPDDGDEQVEGLVEQLGEPAPTST